MHRGETFRARCFEVVLSTALLLATGIVAAQEGGPAPHAGLTPIEERVRLADLARERRVIPLGRLRLSHPQQVSAGIGALLARQPAGPVCKTACELRGLIVRAEPGLAGGQVSAGYAKLVGGTASREQFLSQVYLAWGVKGALLRTWGEANLDPRHQTLLGAEAEVAVINVGFSLGAFRHVGSGDPNHGWVMTGGLGWGF